MNARDASAAAREREITLDRIGGYIEVRRKGEGDLG